MAQFTKIMLVEDEPEVCVEFRSAFEQYKKMSLVYETDSELQALNYLKLNDVDAIILDIELAEGDGLSFLNELEAQRREKLFIVVVTNTGSNTTLGYMRAHGVDYVYQKTNRLYSPFRVLSVIDKLNPYHKLTGEKGMKRLAQTIVPERQKDEEGIVRSYIAEELEKMGFRRKQVGFSYTVEAIYLLIREDDGSRQVSGDVYAAIAQKHQTTRESVEHGIRNAIESAFKGAHVCYLHRYYPFDYDKELGRPANAEFLKNMADRLHI
ncbi:MAG: sporulation initiation factor Spo0A C-terminal domain-containing protein [bacterium]|nr:sporulation initiation factor Spo0A C-terminal domain-containing protein [bacterium]MDY4100329.1 sporulation initiation factor Spo0A C-terminal domain-containing protein [Lachnospiraceae bacterium]